MSFASFPDAYAISVVRLRLSIIIIAVSISGRLSIPLTRMPPAIM
jgi:hypothetical protein